MTIQMEILRYGEPVPSPYGSCGTWTPCHYPRPTCPVCRMFHRCMDAGRRTCSGCRSLFDVSRQTKGYLVRLRGYWAPLWQGGPEQWVLLVLSPTWREDTTEVVGTSEGTGEDRPAPTLLELLRKNPIKL
jgi:hypothetical protein